MLFNVKLKKYKTKYQKLYFELFELNQKIEERSNDKELQLLREQRQAKEEEIDLFENEYAYFLFERYSVKKPKLLRELTGEVYCWDDVFGNDFNALSKVEIGNLICLIELGGKYKILGDKK